MFKRFYAVAVAFLAIGFASCSCAGYANASLPNTFNTTDGQVFSLGEAATVQKFADYVAVQNLDGETHNYPDVSGAMWAKITSSPFFSERFSNIAGTLYINTEPLSYAYCENGNSIFYIKSSAVYGIAYNDLCAAFNNLVTASN